MAEADTRERRARLEDPSWILDQIRSLIQDCTDSIKDDTEALKVATHPEMIHLDNDIEMCQNLRNKLERILKGLEPGHLFKET